MNILFTGMHGFIGDNLAKSLRGHDLYNASTRSSSWGDLSSLPAIDIVIHLAGKAHDTKNKTESQVYFDINTVLTKEIFDWFLQSGARKFIFFSTVKAVADIVDSVLTEDAIPSPKGPYGESKLAAEVYIQAASQKVSTQNKQIYILRPCMIHGIGNKGNLNLLYKVVKIGLPWPLGAFDNLRSFMSIDNLIYIIKELIERDIEPGIYNIADDEALSTNQIIQIMCESMFRKPKIWNINKNIMKKIASLGSLLHLPLSQDRLKKLTENYIVSNKKIKKALVIDKLPLSAGEGLAKTLRSFRQGGDTV
jgi:nucleoside-diphosphate-sugar epimerase